MTRPLDALAEALRRTPLAPTRYPDWNELARACLRAIGEGKVLTPNALANVTANYCDSAAHESAINRVDVRGQCGRCRNETDALLALFREAGE